MFYMYIVFNQTPPPPFGGVQGYVLYLLGLTPHSTDNTGLDHEPLVVLIVDHTGMGHVNPLWTDTTH